MLEVSQQTWIFVQSCILGMGFGLLYDIFRVSRMKVKFQNIVLVFVEDFIYFLFVTVVTFLFMIINTYGQMRFFVIIGEVLGGIVYYFLFSKFFVKIFEIIINVLTKVFVLLFKILISPVLKIFIMFYKYFRSKLVAMKIKQEKIKQNNKYSLKKKRILLYNLIKRRKNKEKVFNGEN